MFEPERKPMIARYRLKSLRRLNALSNRTTFEGALIEIDGGFGCIHPWPELGDPTLEKCLEDLKGARRWPIVRRAIRMAEYDRTARAFDHSLFEEMEVPRSHATLASATIQDVALAVEAGFSTIKLKFGRLPASEAKLLNEMAAEFPQLRWRLDFNESQTPDEIRHFAAALGEAAKNAIDFFEDPTPYSDSGWTALSKELKLKFAVDREAAPLSGSASFMVIKPAIDEPFLLGESAIQHRQRAILTSYMDHPVGQAFAAWEAARLELQFPGLVGLCGLQTHHLFEPDEWTEALGAWTPEFHPPEGTGIGFDNLLDTLPWSRLY
ncbi:MAG: enolase C-terminal domain-like protein [Luteolibacter sp.]